MARPKVVKSEESAAVINGGITDADLRAVQEEILASFGKDSATSLSLSNSKISFSCSTRSIIVDKVIAGNRAQPCPLIPFGRQVEIAGLNGVGKTTLCAMIAAEVQALGGCVVAVDSEERIDEVYWASLGVDVGKILVLHADSIEDAVNKQIRAVKTLRNVAPDRPLLMIWDGIGNLGSRATFDSDEPMSNKDGMAGDARTLSAGMKLINMAITDARACFLYTNSIYKKVGKVFGDPFETSGGEKLKYFATIRLRLSAGAAIKIGGGEDENAEVIGKWVHVRAIKNSMSPNLLNLEAPLLGGRGFCNDYLIFEKGLELGLITQSGGWTKWKPAKGDVVAFHGWPGFLESVVPHAEYKNFFNEVKEKI